MNKSFRRLAVTATALVIASELFRPQVSLALVSRGDDFLYRSQPERALTYYHRAVIVDPGSEVAVDRLAFFSLRSGDTGAAQQVIALTSQFLTRGEDASIRADRALAYLKLRRYAAAAGDFRIAASKGGDARYLRFAGWAASHAGRPAGARTFQKAAKNDSHRHAVATHVRGPV